MLTTLQPLSEIAAKATKQVLGQTNTNGEDLLTGTGDGKLFVLNTFGPMYLSGNHGAILHFATIVDEKPQGSAEKFNGNT